MVTLPIEQQKEICELVIENPKQSRKIISSYLGDLEEITLTVTLPKNVNDFYKYKASRMECSKNEYITNLLTLIASDSE